MKLHIDTDIGSNPDDLCAVALAAKWRDVQITGITTVCDTGGKRAGYAHHALHLAGRHNVPVAAGADVAHFKFDRTPPLPSETRFWFKSIAAHPGDVADALDLLQSSIEQNATIAAIGPLTYLAALERRSPGILESADIFIMGGSLDETNIACDVASARFVVERSNPVIIPIAVTSPAVLRAQHLPRLERADPLARLIAHQAECFERDLALHDPLTCAIGLGWNEGLDSAATDFLGRSVLAVRAIDADAFVSFFLHLVTAP